YSVDTQPAATARRTTKVSGVTFVTGFENIALTPAAWLVNATLVTTGGSGAGGGSSAGKPIGMLVSPAPSPRAAAVTKRHTTPLFVHSPASSQMPAARRAV